MIREPKHIDVHNWFYENPGSITFVHEVLDRDGNFLQTDQVRIPFKKLEDSMERYRRRQVRRKRWNTT